MAYGNNRGGKQPRAHFQQAGGSIIKFRHPYLAGMIETGTTEAIDEIDISACCKLEGRFFEANQNQDSARQTVLIDGSTVTISNKMLNGTISLPVVRTTGLVATGDFISVCQLIKSVGDSVGGVLTKTDFIGGNAITKVYYGVTVQRCPDDVSEGNDVAVYNVSLLYAGWIEATSGSTADNEKKIWAVGSKQGIKGLYKPYSIQNANGNGATQESPLTATSLAPNGDIADTNDGNADNTDEVASAVKSDGVFADAGVLINASAMSDTIPETKKDKEDATAGTESGSTS